MNYPAFLAFVFHPNFILKKIHAINLTIQGKN